MQVETLISQTKNPLFKKFAERIFLACAQFCVGTLARARKNSYTNEISLKTVMFYSQSFDCASLVMVLTTGIIIMSTQTYLVYRLRRLSPIAISESLNNKSDPAAFVKQLIGIKTKNSQVFLKFTF